jgi:hypothetical protein
MHDQQLERHLRAALRAEGDGLALTITAPELERLALRRRRSRASRLVGLGLAAAVTIGLVGLAGAANHWFDGPAVIAQPSPSATDHQGPSVLPSSSPPAAAAILPSLDDLVAAGDRDSVVVAQESGAATGPDAGAPPRPTVDLGPIGGPADYDIRYACIGQGEALLSFVPIGSTPSPAAIPNVTCDGTVRTFAVHLDGPVRLATGTSTASSWRFIIRPTVPTGAPHASAITLPQPDAGERVIIQASGEHPDPDYGQIQTGGGIFVPASVGAMASLDAYHVQVSCAGPSPLRYTFGDDGAPAGFTSYSTTEVACDGAVHDARLGLALPHGATVYVTVDARDAYDLLVTSDTPPVAAAPDESGWQTMIGYGPSLQFEARGVSLSSVIDNPAHEIRVVVSCSGGHSVTVNVDGGVKAYIHVGSFTAPCQSDGATTTAQSFRLPSSSGFTVTAEPDSKMWVVVTVQQRPVAATPKP